MMMFRKAFLTVFLFVAVFMPAQVFAVDKLTEDVIRSHYNMSFEISKSGDADKLIEYLETYIHPDAVATYKYPAAGQDAMNGGFKTDRHTKDSLLALIKKARANAASELLEIEYELTSIEIAEDGQSAKVKSVADTMFDTGQTRYLETSESVDDIVLSDDGQLMFKRIDFTIKNVRYIPN